VPGRFQFDIVGGAPVRTLTWSSAQTIRVAGSFLGVGDRLVIREQSPGLLDSVDSLAVAVRGPAQLRYLDELVTRVPPLPAQSDVGALCMAIGLAAIGARGLFRRST